MDPIFRGKTVPGSEYVHLGFYFRGTKGSVNVCVCASMRMCREKL